MLSEKFVIEHGDDLLMRFKESVVEGRRWHIGSHGAVVRVEGEHDDYFERLFVVVPRPPDAPSARFKSWAEGRIEHYNWYLELTNLGRCVQSVVTDVCAVITVMRRIGHTTADEQCQLPDVNGVFKTLGQFVSHLRHYVDFLGDSDLRYVSAMRVYRVPRINRRDECIIGLDILPTLIGLDRDASPIHPLTLVRGIVGEFAELYERERDAGDDQGGRTKKQLKAHSAKCAEAVSSLDTLCVRIDQHRPALDVVGDWLMHLHEPQPKRAKGSTWSTVFLVLACVALAWYLAH